MSAMIAIAAASAMSPPSQRRPRTPASSSAGGPSPSGGMGLRVCCARCDRRGREPGLALVPSSDLPSSSSRLRLLVTGCLVGESALEADPMLGSSSPTTHQAEIGLVIATTSVSCRHSLNDSVGPTPSCSFELITPTSGRRYAVFLAVTTRAIRIPIALTRASVPCQRTIAARLASPRKT